MRHQENGETNYGCLLTKPVGTRAADARPGSRYTPGEPERYGRIRRIGLHKGGYTRDMEQARLSTENRRLGHRDKERTVGWLRRCLARAVCMHLHEDRRAS